MLKNILVYYSADAVNYFIDRVITITGPVENASKAEGLISEKMRKCFERDTQNYVSIDSSVLETCICQYFMVAGFKDLEKSLKLMIVLENWNLKDGPFFSGILHKCL